MSIETRFDVPLIAAMALREKQIQQNYRPIIAVHKWFARRPGTLFQGIGICPNLATGHFQNASSRPTTFPAGWSQILSWEAAHR